MSIFLYIKRNSILQQLSVQNVTPDLTIDKLSSLVPCLKNLEQLILPKSMKEKDYIKHLNALNVPSECTVYFHSLDLGISSCQ